MKVFALKQVEKNTKRVGKTGTKTILKSYTKKPKTISIYRFPKTSRWGPTQQEILLSVDRPVDQPTVIFLTIATCRSTARSTVPRLWLTSRPGPDPESTVLWTVDRVGQPALKPKWHMHVCAHWSTARSTGRRPGQTFLGI